MTFHQWFAEWSRWAWPLLANHLWQATLFSLIAFVIIALLRQGPARARYTIWLLASAKFALPAALLLFLGRQIGLDAASLLHSASPSTAEPPRGVWVIAQIAEPVTQVVEPVIVRAEPRATHNEVYCALTVIWLMGFAVLFGLWLRQRVRLSLALKAGEVAEVGREAHALERARSRLGIKRSVKLILSPQAHEPGVWGVWKPVVVLPDGIADHLSDAELEAVMTHELVHVARWDNFVSDLHMLLCCLFWFHPIIWLIDRKLLVERERACDDRVIELGAAPRIYAASLLKVFQFGLGWRMAGISCVTGSNLRRRIERIMADDQTRTPRRMHRVAIGVYAATFIVFSIVIGLLAQDSIVGQSQNRPQRKGSRPSGGVQGGVPGGVPKGIVGGVVGGIPGDGVEGSQGKKRGTAPENVPRRKLFPLDDSGGFIGYGSGSYYSLEWQEMERLNEAARLWPDFPVSFENPEGAPLVITTASVKVITWQQYYRVLQLAPKLDDDTSVVTTLPKVTLINSTVRRITGFRLRLANEDSGWSLRIRPLQISIEPGSHYIFQPRWSMLMPGNADSIAVSVEVVEFEDGGKWFKDQSVQSAEQNPESPDSFLLKLARTNRLAEPQAGQNGYGRPVITFTPRPKWTEEARQNRIQGVVVLRATFGADGVVRNIRVEEGLGYGLDEAAVEAARGIKFIPAQGPDGRPASVRATIRVEFSALEDDLVQLSGEELQRLVVHRVMPAYPESAWQARVEGAVVVKVVIDTDGSVISAIPTEGHLLLRQAACEAARQWKFQPYQVSGIATKVSGTLIFNFKL